MTSIQYIFIEPNDVWMFRDSKPFNAQQSFVARSIFPPNPTTIQGAIRTAYLDSQGINWSVYNSGEASKDLYSKIGTDTHLGALDIEGPFVAEYVDQKIQRLYRIPNDVIYDSENETFMTMRPREFATPFATDIPFDGWLPVMCPSPCENFKALSGWFTEHQMKAYLANESIEGKPIPPVVDREERVGLKVNRSRHASEEHHFYHAQFIRPNKNIGLLVGLNQDLFSESGVMRLGGESRTGHYTIVSYTPPRTNQTGRVKIILQTPAYFSAGWCPENFDWSPWVGDGRLVSYVAGKPHHISGWDIANKRPKPLRHYVPAGSVYYFESAQLTGIPFTETPTGEIDHQAMGFGGFVAGIW